MSIFAPVYRPTKHQQTFLVRQQKLENRKRKRGQDPSDEDNSQSPTEQSPEPGPTPRTASTAFHPVSRTDPYRVAGHPRELPLPPPPFPHAAVKEASQPKRSIEEELGGLNPPLYIPSTTEDKSTSLRRRHLDNLTTILHRCMLKGDWKRAFRAWGLLIRTEIAGRGIDVRRNGRWSIGAELLMRRNSTQHGERRRESLDNDEVSESSSDDGVEDSTFSIEGFKLAREYYERLILQYPHTVRTMHTFNATAVYPALFNVWIYEVQERSKRARKNTGSKELSHDNDDSDLASNASLESAQVARLQQIRSEELEQALPIAERLDELFMSPPYDTNSDLLHLRGMVAGWVADLHDEVAALLSKTLDDGEGHFGSPTERHEVQSEIGRHRRQAEEERRTEVESFDNAAVK